MVTLPAVTPVTRPADVTVARAVSLLVQVPPDVLLESVMAPPLPAQSVSRPVIVPKVGALITRNVLVVLVVPQLLL